MIVSGSESAWINGFVDALASPVKIPSSSEIFGAAGQNFTISAASRASEQQIRTGVESFNIAASSTGACRAYSGTTMIPSAIIARSSAAQRILFGASRAHRSPFLNPRPTKNLRACSIKASSSPPVTDTIFPSRTSPSTGAPAARSSRSKMFSRNVITGSESSCHRVAALFHQPAKTGAQRRQIVFPAEHSLTHRKFGEVARHEFFKINSHACHELQVARDGSRHCVADLVSLGVERF